jgi:predicted dehydrogenase
MDSARRQAARFGGDAVTVDAMLNDPTVDLVVNLTPAVEHFQLNERILDAGKHLYTEKPLALSVGDGRDLIERAAASGVRLGSAPETLFGGAHQPARALLDSGVLGAPVLGAAFVGFPGAELFHPAPRQFFRPGMEGPYDIGPYYVTQLVSLLGPVGWVAAKASHGKPRRRIQVGPDAGTEFPVDVPTSFAALLGFDSGAVVTLSTSVEVWKHRRNPMELYCTDGSLTLADPNFFGGRQEYAPRGEDWRPLTTDRYAFVAPNRTDHFNQPVADYRGVGIVDMALALRDDRAHRTQPDLTLHALEVLDAIVTLGTDGGHVTIRTTCRRPAPVDPQTDAELIELMPSPYPLP